MAEIVIDLVNQQPTTKVTINNPKPKKTKNFLYRLTLALIKFCVSIIVFIKDYFKKMADGERVQPAPDENPDKNEESDEPKKGGGRLKLIIKIVVAIVVILALLNFFLWVVINPRKMKFYVTDASLSEFSLSDYDTLRYNLRLNFTARNPNKRMGIRYEAIEGGAYYGGEKFDSGNLVSFYQPPKTTTSLNTWFSGVKKLSLDWNEVKGFEEQKSSGFYPIDVKIRVYSSIKIGKIHMGDFKVKIKCSLKVPLLTSGSFGNYGTSLALSNNVDGFKATQCHVDFNPLIVMYSD